LKPIAKLKREISWSVLLSFIIKRLLNAHTLMIKAVLFDFDGVIVDSEKIHKQTFLEILSIDVPENRWYNEFAGTGSRSIFERLLEENSMDGNPDELVSKRRELFNQYLDRLEPVAGLKEFLEALRKRNIRIAIVSGGHSSYITQLLDMLGISEYFDYIVSADDTEFRKPDPRVFLLASERFNLKPEECLVIEDSYSGCRGARNAGMRLVWMRPEKSMNAPECDLIADDFTRIPLDLLD
jgi:HAD superfamily hydrolase (TIGR01509 family)